jgi:hypothetical protein
MPPSVLRPDWETLARLASRRSKPLDLDTCPTPSSSSISFVAQPTNHSLFSFEDQMKKSSWWFWGSNQQTTTIGFEAWIEKPVATGIEAKAEETFDLGFEAKLRNSRFSSPCARCRPHTVSPDLSIVWPPSTRSVLDHPWSLHQVSYSCCDHHRCPLCHTCHLHTTRQANTILHTR